MRNTRRFYFIPFIILSIVALLSAVVMLLWNNVLAQVVNVKQINFLQAVGLFVLSKILFSSFRPGSPGRFGRGRPSWRNKFADMSEEDRAKFREEWRNRRAGRGFNKNC